MNNPIRKQKQSIPPLLDKDGVEQIDLGEKLKMFLKTYLSPPQPKQVTEEEKSNYEFIERWYERIIDLRPQVLEQDTLTYLNRDILPSEVSRVISSLKRNKAIGPDEIHNRLLKALPEECIIEIAKTFTQCLREGVHPKVWNCSNTAPIPKPGKELNRAKNFRPIAISSCLGRILEKIIAGRLQTYCLCNRIFENNQCGFQINKAT